MAERFSPAVTCCCQLSCGLLHQPARHSQVKQCISQKLQPLVAGSTKHGNVPQRLAQQAGVGKGVAQVLLQLLLQLLLLRLLLLRLLLLLLVVVRLVVWLVWLLLVVKLVLLGW
jgi:hypothetical protein